VSKDGRLCYPKRAYRRFDHFPRGKVDADTELMNQRLTGTALLFEWEDIVLEARLHGEQPKAASVRLSSKGDARLSSRFRMHGRWDERAAKRLDRIEKSQ
jgi:hypothetical protein